MIRRSGESLASGTWVAFTGWVKRAAEAAGLWAGIGKGAVIGAVAGGTGAWVAEAVPAAAGIWGAVAAGGAEGAASNALGQLWEMRGQRCGSGGFDWGSIAAQLVSEQRLVVLSGWLGPKIGRALLRPPPGLGDLTREEVGQITAGV